MSLFNVKRMFHREVGPPSPVTRWLRVLPAMPESLKYDTSIDDVTAYQIYVNSKPWVYYNYLKLPDRRPTWVTNPDEQTDS